ncbi:MAG: bifunctional diaminohydroxyphosphoribosylaminopyrimidine deaminase/5-amino-6-(5-phosphoribosylamino)uracil reductase RibD [Kiritimatiellia bacterium]|nr:bifunctional diaminohydroxyphosphoribosylaminopyrimidine deaminase/5-amino-6-(5-phosphoribosylamino)uracil reductase RibD [Kiritimatiellia bacterium]MDP6631830.1 bifunctional diaminohydroxyphosphoribosylaminopyrimidine deaminase/5-amino-6-(5-phosphoribosylamino)uracil reductase RibD [Kiritimatiellia bacterium]MDP6811532.1 bifunctional diaminohydroxyphosphoribosylaminopyrimidine deaminase/5-amino-6-(5-phosphoribosylamino)uracil reductase RibD [Kiritimatiellia bacterium]MDP6971970.1 bifunctiona
MRTDEQWMGDALALARRGVGHTRPNPPVGCVIVKRGRRVGHGYHRAAGKPHAEVEALRVAGEQAAGADVYVTLEPCSTTGRTGPCTEALISAGVRRVVVAVRDPNPAHAGRGLRKLRAAGIEVQCGACRPEAGALIEPFASWVTRGRPWITLKLATSLDGAIADRTGRSRWISGPAAGRWVDRMRSEVDVIMVGSGTALQDDPGLLPRNRRRPTAHRLVLDSRGRLSTSAKLLNDTWSELSVVATGESTSRRKQAAWQRHGAAVWPLPAKGGHLSLKALARRMGKEGWLHVLCEGGGGLAASLLREKLVDELVMIVAPVVMGGGSALPAFGEPGWLLNQAPRFKRIEQCELGQDMLLRLRPETT